MDNFIQKIYSNLAANGYPQKKVSFNLETMYEIADNKGLSFNKVIEVMREQGVSITLNTDKVIFSKTTNANTSENPFEQMDSASLMQNIQEIMSKMSPDQLNELEKMYTNMSEEEKASLMQKGKDMGII